MKKILNNLKNGDDKALSQTEGPSPKHGGPLGLGPTFCEGRSPVAAFTGSPSKGELTFQNHEFIFLRDNIVVYTSWKEISQLS